MSEIQPMGGNLFKERFSRNIEVKIETDKIKNTQINASDLLKNNVEFFGSEDKQKGSELALRVLGKYGRTPGYKSFESILEACDNPNGNKKVAESDRDSMVDAVFIAMNASALGKDLVTDQLSAEDIDSLLVEEVKGVGKFIKERKITKEEESDLLIINKRIEEEGLFDKASDETRGKFYGKWEKKDGEDGGSLVRMYVETCRERMKDIGIKEEIKNVMEESGRKVGDGKEIDEAAKKFAEAADKIKDVFGKDKETDLSTPEKAFKYASVLLDRQENSTYPTNEISENTRQLNTLLDQIRLKMYSEKSTNPDVISYKDVDLMIRSRLALHDSAYYMEDSAFKLSDRGGISVAVDKIGQTDRVLTEERLKFLLRDSGKKKFGVPIDEAWDWIQRANFDYEGVLDEMVADPDMKISPDEAKDLLKLKLVNPPYDKGTTIEGFVNGYWMDSNSSRKQKVDTYIIKKIKESTGMDAAKAYQLAHKLVSASGERSTFNFGLVNGDDFAECIHFAYYRADDARKGKNVGAMSNMDVQSLTPGWLRRMSGRYDTGMIKAKDIFVEGNNEKNTFVYYFTQEMMSKVLPVKQAFLDNAPDPKKMVAVGANYFNSIVDCFSKTDPSVDIVNLPGLGWKEVELSYDYDYRTGKRVSKYKISGVDNDVKKVGEKFLVNGEEREGKKSREGKKGLRSKYALGVLELVATKDGLGWDNYNLMDLRKAMVETKLSTTADSFLNEGMWNWISSQVIAHDESSGKEYNFAQAMLLSRRRAGRRVFFKGFIDGIKGK